MRLVINLHLWIIYALILSLFFNSSTMEGGIFSIIYWGASGIACLYLLFGKAGKGFLSGKKNIVHAAIMFLFVSFVSNILSVIKQGNVELKSFTGSIEILLSYIVNILFLTMTVGSYGRTALETELRKIATFIVLLEAVPIMLGTYQAFIVVKKIPFGYSSTGVLEWAGRYYTFFANPNGHSSIVFVGFAMAQYLKYCGLKKRVCSWLTIFQIFCFINLCMTASRGTLVAIIGSWCLFDYLIYYKSGIRRIMSLFAIKRVLMILVCAVTLYLSCNYIPNIIPKSVQYMMAENTGAITAYAYNEYSNNNQDRVIIRDYYEHGDDVSNHRFELWKYGIKTALEHPLIGVGIYGKLSASCHNAYITTLLAYGFLGFSLFCYIIVSVYRCAIRNALKYKDMIEKRKFVVIICCMTGIFIIGLTNDVLMFTFEFVNVFGWYFMGHAMKSVEAGS